MLATTAHRSAVAHYVEQSFLAWDGFHERIIAQFLSRLLTFPIKPADARPLQTFQLDDDIRALIADRPTAAAAAATDGAAAGAAAAGAAGAAGAGAAAAGAAGASAPSGGGPAEGGGGSPSVGGGTAPSAAGGVAPSAGESWTRRPRS